MKLNEDTLYKILGWLSLIFGVLLIIAVIVANVSALDCTKLAGKNNSTIKFVLNDETNTLSKSWIKSFANSIVSWIRITQPFKNYSISVYNGSCSMDSNDVNVTFTDRLPYGINGGYPQNILWSSTYKVRDKYSFMHELGHAYGLDHSDEEGNYMSYGQRRNRYTPEQQVIIKENING